MQYLLQILHLSCQVQRLPGYQASWSVAEWLNASLLFLFKKCIIKQLLNSVLHDIMNYQNLVSVLSASAFGFGR